MRVLRTHLLGASGALTSDESGWLQITRRDIWAGAADVVRSHSQAVNTGGNRWEFAFKGDGTTLTALVHFRKGDVSIQSVR